MIDICGMLPQNTLKKTVRCVKRKISDQATQDPLDLQAHHQRPEGTDGWNPTFPVDTVDGNQKSRDHQLRLVEVVYPIIYKVFFHTRRLLGISSINSMVNYPTIFRVSYMLRWLFGISEPSTVPPYHLLIFLDSMCAFFGCVGKRQHLLFKWRDGTQFLFGGMIFWIWKSNYISSQQVWMCDEYLPRQTIASPKVRFKLIGAPCVCLGKIVFRQNGWTELLLSESTKMLMEKHSLCFGTLSSMIIPILRKKHEWNAH